MPFDISSAVEAQPESIPTTKFDISSAQEINPKSPKSTPSLSGFLRTIFRGSVIEGLQTKQDELDFLQKNPNATKDQFAAMVNNRERDIISQGLLRQAEAPMQLAIASEGMVNPIGTAKAIGLFSIKDHFINARRWIDENKPNTPLIVKDIVEALDLAATGYGIGKASFSKDFILNRWKDINAPKSVQIPPEQVEGIKKNESIINTLEIKPEQIDASISSQTPIEVPVEKFIDLAQKPEWNKTKELLGIGGEDVKVKEGQKGQEILKEPKASSVISYVDQEGNKIINELTPEELSHLKDEVKNIPAAQEGSSQIHLDADTANLRKAGKLVSREEFIQGHPQAARLFESIPSSVSRTAIETKLPSPEIPQPPVSPPQKVENVLGSPSPESMPKERGFVKSVKESPMVTPETKAGVENLPPEIKTYDAYSDKEAVAKAQTRVASDPEEALHYVLSSESLDKDVTTTGIELMRKYREQGKTEQEVNMAAHLAEKGTKGGQFIQAFSILDKMSPDGVLVFAQRELNRGIEDVTKRKTITPDFADQLKKQAQVIQETPYGYQKVIEVKKLTEMISDKKGRSASDWITELANLPRSLAASFFDFSFGLRQGIFLLPSFPKEWGSAFGKQFGAFAKEENYNALMDSIMKNPDHQLAVDSGIAFTDIRTNLTKVEEQYHGASLAEKIPILGKGVIATERAYTAMANKMRMDVFSKMIKDYENIGIDPRSNKKLLKQTATFINAGTGRGGLAGVFQGAAKALNAFFFSPRLMSSRLTLLNPVYYITREPALRKQALKSLFSFMGFGMTILGVSKLMGAQVGTDPRSSDFGKIKIGDTRIDTWGGFQQYVRMAAQEVSGEYVSSTTGKKLTLGEGYKPLTRLDILMRQIESKEAPIFSLITDLLKGQTFDGKKIDVPQEVAQKFVPMVAQDLYDIAQDDPNLLPLGLLSVFGAGVQTYKPKKSNKF